MMRNIFCFAFVAFFSLASIAPAADMQGVYFTPKFLFGIQSTGDVSKDNMAKGFGIGSHSQAVFGGALSAGYNWAPKFGLPIRTELEFALRSASYDSGDGRNFVNALGAVANTDYDWHTNSHTLFFNAYFDLETGTPFTPYIGGGLGLAFNYAEVDGNATNGAQTLRIDSSQYDTTFAWNVGVGFAYAFNENVALDAGYRFIGLGHREYDFGHDAKIDHSPYINEFYTGLRFSF